MSGGERGQVKTLSLFLSPVHMYGVRNSSPSQWSDPKNIDVGGINLNTEAILVSGLLIVQL